MWWEFWRPADFHANFPTTLSPLASASLHPRYAYPVNVRISQGVFPMSFSSSCSGLCLGISFMVLIITSVCKVPRLASLSPTNFFLSTDLNFQLLFPIGCPRDTSNPIHPKQNLLFLPLCQAYFYCWILCPCKWQRHRPKQHKSSIPRCCLRRYLPAIRTLISMGFYLCCSLTWNAFHLDFPRSRSKACSFVRSA